MAVSLYLINRQRLLTESKESDAQLYLSDAHRAVDELGSGFAEDLVGVPGAEQFVTVQCAGLWITTNGSLGKLPMMVSCNWIWRERTVASAL